MSELNIEWTPEMGVKCEFTWGAKQAYYTCFYHGRTQSGLYIFELEDGQLKDSEHYRDIKFRPFKSEAEKQRDKQIEAISKILSVQGIHLRYISRKTAAEALYKAGCRMTRELTQDVITELYRKHLVTIVAGSGYEFARSIEAHILGEN